MHLLLGGSDDHLWLIYLYLYFIQLVQNICSEMIWHRYNVTMQGFLN